MYKWPLNVSNFSWFDRFKLCGFFLNPSNFWTQNNKVKEFEIEMAKFVGSRYAIFVSSGSAANTILAMYLKDKLKKENNKRNIIILPSTTWTTSCSPWIREGFEPHFIDISLDNFGLDLKKTMNYLIDNHEKVAAIFPTSLLGFNTDFIGLNNIRENYPDIKIFIDQCENNFANLQEGSLYINPFKDFTSTTSTYMGHEIQSVEGGFIFTNSFDEYVQFTMYRNHGMTRSLDNIFIEKNNNFINKKVDKRFDFYCLGNNFRNSDINAYIGLLDIKRVDTYIKKRRKLYGIYQFNINRDRYILPMDNIWNVNKNTSYYVPFCIPIICKGNTSQERLFKIKKYCIENQIETRPIVSGFLGYQTAYQGFMDEKGYPNSIYLHNNGIYVGLNTKIKEKQILKLVKFLNKI